MFILFSILGLTDIVFFLSGLITKSNVQPHHQNGRPPAKRRDNPDNASSHPHHRKLHWDGHNLLDHLRQWGHRIVEGLRN